MPVLLQVYVAALITTSASLSSSIPLAFPSLITSRASKFCTCVTIRIGKKGILQLATVYRLFLLFIRSLKFLWVLEFKVVTFLDETLCGYSCEGKYKGFRLTDVITEAV